MQEYKVSLILLNESNTPLLGVISSIEKSLVGSLLTNLIVIEVSLVVEPLDNVVLVIDMSGPVSSWNQLNVVPSKLAFP